MSIRKLLLAAAVMASPLVLAACETAEGYRQEMSMWQGRTGDDLIIKWGEPQERSTLSDGRQVWSYKRRQEVKSGDYYRDETRQVTRTFKDKDGKEKTETITETFPVYVPPSVSMLFCTTRFVLSPEKRIDSVDFSGDACVAPERDGANLPPPG